MILLVDNRDSYTHNLAQLISMVAGVEPMVISADDVVGSDIDSRLKRGEFSHVVISPGPGTPESDADFLGSRRVIEAALDIPLLGVCLGHQGLGYLAGMRLERTAPQHGVVCTISHSGQGIFSGIPQHFKAVRYHSLHVVDNQRREGDVASGLALGGDVRVHAQSDDGVVQAIEISGRAHWGVQFHPESVLSSYGEQLMRNFLMLAPLPHRHDTQVNPPEIEPATAGKLRWGLTHHRVDASVATEKLFRALRAAYEPHADVFWLDSATQDGFSIMGTLAGSLSRSFSYTLGSSDTDILKQLEAELSAEIDTTGLPELPFMGGLVGYLGYECAALTLPHFSPSHSSPYPDAYWMRPQSFIVYDHRARQAHLMVLYLESPNAETKELLDRLYTAVDTARGSELPSVAVSGSSSGLWRMRKRDYYQRIDQIKAALERGDSYEVCLTDTFDFTTESTGFDLYCALRKTNPAPYAAYFSCGDIEVLSSSPERFLSVRDGIVTAKPIKGTISRTEDAQVLLDDAKMRAEHLMIVDLLRNDLGRVCQSGTVDVPGLMEVETFATVHQLVSTVTGVMKTGTTLPDLIRTTFPGGSMTGAPKLRTCHIIDQLETSARGVYSGTLGYLGFNGSADMSIVIRTAIKQGDKVSVGAGGAIVWDSDAEDEWVEKQLKSQAVVGGLL